MNPEMMAMLKPKKTQPAQKPMIKKPMPKPPVDISGSFDDAADRIIQGANPEAAQVRPLDVQVNGETLQTPEEIADWVINTPEIRDVVYAKYKEEMMGDKGMMPSGDNGEY